MDVCIAIPTWNRAGLLRQALESLAQLRVPAGLAWEVVVVDNGCTDETPAVVAGFEGRLPALRRVREPVPGLAAARNRALETCRARYLLFTDDDGRVDPGWLEAFVAAAREFPAAGVFGGPVVPWFPEPPDPELCEVFPEVRSGFCGVDHEWPLGLLPERLYLAGANMAFRADAIGSTRFDPALGMNRGSLVGGEDHAFVHALRARGVEVVWVPEMSIEHTVDPARLQIDYLIRFAHDRARTHVRLHGIPRGPRVAGAPLKLWRRYARAIARAGIAALGGHGIRRAGHWARCERYRGRIKECRALSRSGAAGYLR